MKKILFFIFITVNCFASEKMFGLGINIGNPTGLRLHYYITPQIFSNTTIGWNFSDNGWVDINQDFILSKDFKKQPETGELSYYYGLGLRLKTNETKFGFRFPVGINYDIKNIPVWIYLEITPYLNIYKDTTFDLLFSIGAIYYLF
ncbi:MAG: hypothetical protein J7L54_05610 [Elusimicrobia bacterium]|nr:hypothetical protein [Elusimicrobiota bacterium]